MKKSKKNQKKRNTFNKANKFQTATTSKVNSIEQALERFSKLGLYNSPNYSEFYNWISDYFKDDSSTGGYHDYRVVKLESHKHEFVETYAKYKNIIESSSENPIDFIKFKLLFGAKERFGKRFEDVIEVITTNRNLKKEDLDIGIDECTQAELRLRLFVALDHFLEKISFKILGKLKKEEHDLGEIDYFEALAYFKLNDFESALRYAKKVPNEAIDYDKSLGIEIESNAFIGNTDEVLSRLDSIDTKKLSMFFVIYILQILIMNAKDCVGNLEKIINFVDTKFNKVINVPLNDTFFPIYNRYSCNLAIQFVQKLINEYSAELASQQTNFKTITEDIYASEYVDETSMKLKVALKMFDRQLFEALENYDIKSKYEPIISRLLFDENGVNPEFDDYILALLTKLRLGGGYEFVDDIAQYFVERDKKEYNLNNPKIIEISELAYTEAISLGHPQVKFLESILIDNESLVKKKSLLNYEGRIKKLINSLSPMAQQAYFSADYLLNLAIERDNRWQDAGMISLGFFRILELELNNKLFIPFRDSVNCQEFLTNLRILIKDFSFSKQDKLYFKHKKPIDFWERMLGQLEKFFLKKISGLELGSIELLISKTKNNDGIDQKVKKLIFEAISNQLSEHGVNAYKSGELEKIAGELTRNRYRNPPAHSRYLPLSTAIECKEYVENSLFKLSDWYKKNV